MADVKELIEGMNEDLSAEYQAVVMYRTYAALVTGPWRQELRGFFESEMTDHYPEDYLDAQKSRIPAGRNPDHFAGTVRERLDREGDVEGFILPSTTSSTGR